MTKHDPDLCARVARVMGRKHTPCHCGFYKWDRHHRCDRPGPVDFKPDTDPADAWRVLEWVSRRYDVRWFAPETHRGWLQLECAPFLELWFCGTEEPEPVDPVAIGRGDDIMTALMDAVAAMGGEE